MKCKDSEEIIYLFHESTDAERFELMKHLESCATCSKLFEEVRATSKLVAETAGQRSLPVEPGILTNRIMRSLPDADASESLWTHILGLFDLSVVKYSMALASVMFIVVFLAEYQEPAGDMIVHPHSAGIVIRSSGLREEFRTREKRASIFDCKGMTNKIDLDCVKEKIQKLSF